MLEVWCHGYIIVVVIVIVVFVVLVIVVVVVIDVASLPVTAGRCQFSALRRQEPYSLGIQNPSLPQFRVVYYDHTSR